MRYATQDDFRRAPVGHPFLECCGLCGNETGAIALKKQAAVNWGRASDGNDWGIPKYLVSAEARCEFCEFVRIYLASEKPEAGKKWGAMKLVTEDQSGVRTLLAYVPFNEDDLDKGITVNEEKVEPRHGMVVRCIKQEDGMVKLEKVVERGIGRDDVPA